MITRHRSDEDAFINQLIMGTPRKNVNKDGIVNGSRPRDVTEVSKYCKNSKEMTFFTDVLCLSRLCLEAIYTMCIFVRDRVY